MRVQNLEHLKTLSTNKNGNFVDFYISLANGLVRSSKGILYDSEKDVFSLFHEIDGSYQEFHTSEIEKVTTLIHAINCGALFKE